MPDAPENTPSRLRDTVGEIIFLGHDGEIIEPADDGQGLHPGTPQPSRDQAAVHVPDGSPAYVKPLRRAAGANTPASPRHAPTTQRVHYRKQQREKGRRRWVAIPLALIVAVLGVILYDQVSHADRAYNGVSVGSVDVSGMTREQIVDALDASLAPLLKAPVKAYASQEALDANAKNRQISDSDSVEDARAATVVWEIDASDIGASIDIGALADQALAQGRDGIVSRLGVMREPHSVPVSLTCDDAAIEAVAGEIDQSIGTPYVDYGIEVENGKAGVTRGSDGSMVNRSLLKQQLTTLMLEPDDAARKFVATTEHAPVHIDRPAALECAQNVNEALGHEVTFVYGDYEWNVDSDTLGELMTAQVVESTDGSYTLVPQVNEQKAVSAILLHVQPSFADGSERVTFDKIDDEVSVHVYSSGTMPMVKSALNALNESLFGGADDPSNDGASVQLSASGHITIQISSSNIPDVMTLDDALSCGIITPISSFTTQFAEGATARNHNIALAARLINRSVASADGGVWSFNEIAGECNAEKGFRAATAIVDDQTVDEIGGGICQVATTVFNAVYDAGFPITDRSNHTLYIASYPAGRDAAISWPLPDLTWSNDSASDVMMLTESDESSITVTLYGVDPGYSVSTTEGQWVDGGSFETVYEDDPTQPSGVEYYRQEGVNGRSISITRTVYDSQGLLRYNDVFYSNYLPQNAVIVRGVG